MFSLVSWQTRSSSFPQPCTRAGSIQSRNQRFVRAVAAEIPEGVNVLDAGAGEGRFEALFAHTRYVGIDFAQGDPSWDYSKLGYLRPRSRDKIFRPSAHPDV